MDVGYYVCGVVGGNGATTRHVVWFEGVELRHLGGNISVSDVYFIGAHDIIIGLAV